MQASRALQRVNFRAFFSNLVAFLRHVQNAVHVVA